MKYQGRYEFAGHGIPGRPIAALKYSGREQKPILTREALKRGADDHERVMIFDMIRDGNALVAIGVSTRENKTIEFLPRVPSWGQGSAQGSIPARLLA